MLLTPSTKEMASITLLFPDPFGPMMQVKFLNGPITCEPLRTAVERVVSKIINAMGREERVIYIYTDL
jgi:hypothetical protein